MYVIYVINNGFFFQLLLNWTVVIYAVLTKYDFLQPFALLFYFSIQLTKRQKRKNRNKSNENLIIFILKKTKWINKLLEIKSILQISLDFLLRLMYKRGGGMYTSCQNEIVYIYFHHCFYILGSLFHYKMCVYLYIG